MLLMQGVQAYFPSPLFSENGTKMCKKWWWPFPRLSAGQHRGCSGGKSLTTMFNLTDPRTLEISALIAMSLC